MIRAERRCWPGLDTRVKPIRVVHVIQSVESGGAEQQLLTLTRAQDWQRWQPYIVCTHELGSLGSEFAAAEVPVEVVGKRSHYDVTLIPRLASAIARHKPGIIQTWLESANFWGRLAALFVPGRPIIISSVRTIGIRIHPEWLYDVADRALVHVTDMVVGNSLPVNEYLVKTKHLPAKKVMTIRNGIALDRVQTCISWSENERRAYREQLGLPADAFVVGNVAQPVKEKRLDLFVEVLHRLYRRGVPVRALQLGRDPHSGEAEYFARYRQWVHESGVEALILRRGFVRDVSPELAIMDALVQSSDIEGLPNAVAEAQAMEVPVVATNAGGTAELVIHRQTGWLAPTGDVDGLTAGLEYVYRHREEARAWGVAARQHVETNFSVAALVRNTTSLYTRLLRERGRPVPTEE